MEAFLTEGTAAEAARLHVAAYALTLPTTVIAATSDRTFRFIFMDFSPFPDTHLPLATELLQTRRKGYKSVIISCPHLNTHVIRKQHTNSASSKILFDSTIIF